MGLSEERRAIQWNEVMQALAEAGVDGETVHLVEAARTYGDLAHWLARMLLGAADHSQPKNYLKFDMVGLTAPFDRAYVELVRPGGKTSHELRTLLRDRLASVRRLLAEGAPDDALLQGVIAGIDEDLATEAT